ncbi:MAG TPA: AsmA-like C-terminal region-containing protein [Bryobacteraceae bacterium]|nr:AsmA-like C-terminal region-containing protein [Bryobacteraceae bacterium]
MWTWIAVLSVIVLATLAIAAVIVVHRAVPIVKARITETLSARFHGRVELDSLNVSALPEVEVSGDGLRIYPPDGVVAAGATQPLIAVGHFSFQAGPIGLLVKPTHVRTVQVTGLQITIPPHEMWQQVSEKAEKHGGKIGIAVDEIVCDRSRLIIGTSKPDKDPKDFELKHIELHNVGPNRPWHYDAAITNAIPRGDIHAAGFFGPWQADSPGDSAVSGHYTFDHADLNTIKGIGGILSSVGDFQGQLDRIAIDGTTETPDFSLDTANHPLPLHTHFHAFVDGINGDTSLDSIEADLRGSKFTTKGSVIDLKGRGHAIDLDIDVPQGQIQDFLDLAVQTQPAVMTGTVGSKAKLHIRPGKERVVEKLSLKGNFTLQQIHFTNPQVQDKVDMMSLRARGKPKEAKPGAEDVNSHMSGTFDLNDAVMRFRDLDYVLPGARVNLGGIYSLDGQQFDFHGTVRTAVSLSQMVDSPWLSFLLKAARPFFGKKGGGAEIPVHISGTKSAPKFGLDVLHGHSDSGEAAGDRKH